MQLVNLTGHDLAMDVGDGTVRWKNIRSKAWVDTDVVSEEWAKVTYYEFGEEEGMRMRKMDVPVLSLRENGVRGLPPRDPDVLYVVSGIVAAKAGRSDVVSPGRVSGFGEERKARCLIRHVQ